MTAPSAPSKHQDFLALLAKLDQIPAHDPARYATTDGLDNPECTNGDRVLFAVVALDSFQNACGMVENLETAASDFVCDLMHLLHANAINILPVLNNGIGAFLVESGSINGTGKQP